MESHLAAGHQAQNYLRDVCIVSKTFQSASLSATHRNAMVTCQDLERGFMVSYPLSMM